MKNRITNRLMLSAIALFTLMTSCKKEFDSPPIQTIPTGNVKTLAEIKAMYTGTAIKFTEDLSVYGVVSMDENSGNLYKNIFVQDSETGINVRLLSSGGVYEGDSIRIYLKGTLLSTYNGVYQLDSVDVDKNIIKQKTKVPITPISATIGTLGDMHDGKLIKLDNVEFLEIGLTYADAINQSSQNRTLMDCNGNSLLVRTSGYANFAGTTLPSGNGSIIGVLSRFGSDLQLYVRTPAEVIMNNTRCDGTSGVFYLSKNFEDNSATSGGWTNVNASGSINWSTNSIGAQSGSYYAQCSNFVGGANSACETWLISPATDLTSSSNPVFSFLNAYKYNGTTLAVYVSTNYTSGAPSSATWTQLSPTLSSGNFAWVSSGLISLSSYKTSNVRVAFKYVGSASDGSTWELDDIKIGEQ